MYVRHTAPDNDTGGTDHTQQYKRKKLREAAMASFLRRAAESYLVLDKTKPNRTSGRATSTASMIHTQNWMELVRVQLLLQRVATVIVATRAPPQKTNME